MEITINGNKTTVPNNDSLWSLLERLSFAHSEGLAVAINEEVVPREEWASTLLSENDAVLVITATQGG